MRILTFKYTDLKGNKSDRVLAAMHQPGDHFEGIDLSDLDDYEIAEFSAEYNKLHDEFVAKTKVLQNLYDLAHNYRRFAPSRMSNQELEVL